MADVLDLRHYFYLSLLYVKQYVSEVKFYFRVTNARDKEMDELMGMALKKKCFLRENKFQMMSNYLIKKKSQ